MVESGQSRRTRGLACPGEGRGGHAGGAWPNVSALQDEGPNQLWVQQRLLERPVHVEVMDVGGSWGGLEGRSPWALRNRQLRGVGRQGSCEEVLVQEGLRVASKGQQKETGHLPVPASATSRRGGDVNIALKSIFPSSAHRSGDSNTSECSLFEHCSRHRRCSGKQNKELCLQVFHKVRGGGNKHDKEVRQTVHQMISAVGKRKV